MFRFIAADLRRHWPGVVAIVMILALATALGVAVTLQERALRLGSARAAAPFDLLVGAAGSETQLLLSAVFLQPAPLPLLPGKALADLAADPKVAWAAPIGFGDFVGRDPLVGTTPALVAGLGGIAEGRGFRRLGEAVAGADAGEAVGAAFSPLHGRLEDGGRPHVAIRYTVVGRLARTHTAFDRAVLVPIEAVWAIHGSEARGTAPRPAGTAPVLFHEPPVDLDRPIDPDAERRPDAPGVPAILVKPRTIADAYKLRAEYRAGDTLAIFPGEVLTRLYRTLGDARSVLAAVAAGAQLLVGAAMLLVAVIHVLQRRRQIGALRAFGAPRGVVFAIVWLQLFAITAAGVLLGALVGYCAVRAASPIVAGSSGVELPVVFQTTDALSLALLLGVTGALALLPAALAYRQSPAAALRG